MSTNVGPVKRAKVTVKPVLATCLSESTDERQTPSPDDQSTAAISAMARAADIIDTEPVNEPASQYANDGYWEDEEEGTGYVPTPKELEDVVYKEGVDAELDDMVQQFEIQGIREPANPVVAGAMAEINQVTQDLFSRLVKTGLQSIEARGTKVRCEKCGIYLSAAALKKHNAHAHGPTSLQKIVSTLAWMCRDEDPDNIAVHLASGVFSLILADTDAPVLPLTHEQFSERLKMMLKLKVVSTYELSGIRVMPGAIDLRSVVENVLLHLPRAVLVDLIRLSVVDESRSRKRAAAVPAEEDAVEEKKKADVIVAIDRTNPRHQ